MEKVGKIYRAGLVKNIKDGIEKSTGVFLLTYSSVSSSQMDTLRKDLSKLGAKVSATKNRVAKVALKEVNQEKLAESIGGQTVFVWTNADSVAVSKKLIEFSKGCEGLVIKAGLYEGSLLSKDDIKRLSDLPSREVLISQLLALMLSPVSRLAGILNAKSEELLSILKQYSEKKGGN